MKAIVLAGGQGLRLRPLTDDRPKPMVLINGKPLAEIQLTWLRKHVELERVAFACRHRWEKLKDYFGAQFEGVPIDYVVEPDALGTGGGIRNALVQLGIGDEDVLIANGDVVTDLPLSRMVEFHRANAAIVTMLLVPYRSPYGVVRIDKLRVVRKFEEKPEFPDTWINGGVYIVQAKKLLSSLPQKGDVERETFPKLTEYGEIAAYPYYGFWRALDSLKDLSEVEHELVVAKPGMPSGPREDAGSRRS
jgi:NDP-sugar pyrophosphorylase family protein